MSKLANKVALVTGGSRGIGAAISERLADDGAVVIINFASSPAPAQELATKIESKHGKGRAILVQADISKPEGIEKLKKSVPNKLDVLVHCAGIMPPGLTLEGFDSDSFDNVFSLNVKAPLLITQALAPSMSAGSSIIFITTSILRATAFAPDVLIYVASKGAIHQAIRILSKELAAKGIRVTGLAPGPTATELFIKPKTEQQIKFFENLSPFKKLGQPEEIASACSFLAGPDAVWVSGETLFTNGATFV